MKEVSAALVIKEGKIFIAQRPEGKPLPNLWEFPGGKLEEGETLQQCLKREIKEELSLDVEVGDFIMDTTYSYPNGEFKINLYRTYFPENAEPKLNVHQKFAWVAPEDLDNYEFPPADTDIIRHLKITKLK